jgi:hypothetical protein
LKKSRDRKFAVAVVAVLVFLLFSSCFAFVTLQVAQVNAQPATTVPADMLQYEWRQAQSDPEGTCFGAGPAPNAANIKWKVHIDGVSGQPIAFNGLVFVNNYIHTYALDGGTGAVVWTSDHVGNVFKIDDNYMMIGNTCSEQLMAQLYGLAHLDLRYLRLPTEPGILLNCKCSWITTMAGTSPTRHNHLHSHGIELWNITLATASLSPMVMEKFSLVPKTVS